MRYDRNYRIMLKTNILYLSNLHVQAVFNDPGFRCNGPLSMEDAPKYRKLDNPMSQTSDS